MFIADRVFELDVLGYGPAVPDPEAPYWYVPSDGRGRKMRPLYLAHCVCDLERILDSSDVKTLGHWAECLEVVEFYSRDIAAAWQVVEKMRTDGWDMGLRCDAAGGVEVWFGRPEWVTSNYGASVALPTARAKTVPLAICRAALLAVGVSDA